MDIWTIHLYKPFAAALDPLPGDYIGQFEIAAESEDDALNYILHRDKNSKVVGENRTANGWRLIAVEYQDEDAINADVYIHTWIITKDNLYRMPPDDNKPKYVITRELESLDMGVE